MYAYEQNERFGWFRIHFFCLLTSVVDALVTIGIYALLTKIGLTGKSAFYIFSALLGAVCAVVFEWFAFAFGLWSYNRLMPVTPFLGVGLLPFAQLTLLVPLSIWLTEALAGRRRRQTENHQTDAR